MEGQVPDFLQKKLVNQYGEDLFQKILSGYRAKRFVTLRVNTLKTNVDFVKDLLKTAGISYQKVSWSKEALIVQEIKEAAIWELPVYKEGGVYLQSLSSMIPPVFLAPKGGENILDMAAAPGGKTTQMAA